MRPAPRGRVRAEAGRLVGRLFDRVFAAYAACGAPTGTPIAWYDDTSGDVLVGAGLDSPLADPEAFGLTTVTLPGSDRSWVATYRGPLPGVIAAWGELAAHLEAVGDHPVGICREIYHQVSLDGSSDWVIELQQPVAPRPEAS